MSRLILQPSGNSGARQHYNDTIDNPVNFERLSQYLNQDELNTLRGIYPNEECFVWGVTPGGKNSWNRIARGDVALFSRDGGIYASAVVTHKLHNHNLAEDLWGVDSAGNTWEYIYFLDEIRSLNIRYPEFNQTILTQNGKKYADNFIIQRFSVLEPEQTREFFAKFDLQSDNITESVDERRRDEALLRLKELKETDAETRALIRLEQSYLKTILFGDSTTGSCACCGNEYPVSYLVTAHIKKRAMCTFDERRDSNVVFPMCKMGCDELFERGYIAVKNGQIISLNKTPSTDSLNNYIENINGNECSYFNADNEKYFRWHREFHNG